MKKFLFLLPLASVVPARAAQIVNVDYIVKYVKQKHGVDVPHNAEQIRWAANMEYLLGVVDWVNKQNGYDTSYGKDPKYATRIAVDTIAANKAIDELIKARAPVNQPHKCSTGATFCFMPTSTSTSYSITIWPVGNYTIDWGDGTVDNATVPKGNSGKTFSHSYKDGKTAATHLIGIDGKATASNDTYSSAYRTIDYLESSFIDGCLGCIFPTLANGVSPHFEYTFADSTFSAIPAGFFSGITGTFSSAGMFYDNDNLKEIPRGLFSDLTTGNFYEMFSHCEGLQEIPSDLFSTITDGRFERTFSGCRSLQEIPDGIFDGLDTTIEYHGNMFYNTFYGCSSLTGPSARVRGKYLYNIWTGYQVTDTYDGCINLSDYKSMPNNWK